MNRRCTHALLVIALAAVLCLSASAATIAKKSTKRSAKVTETAKTQKKIASRTSSRPAATTASKSRKRRRGSSYQWVNGHRLKRNRYYERFTAASFVEADQTSGDVTEGEDPNVRAAAIDALGNMNGTVVAIDPTSGRILAMVNQKLALSEGAEPCSTIKLSVALAGLSEKVITREESIALGGRAHMSLTQALAHSNNAYFEAVGRRLGFPKVSYYAHQFGLGELAGYNIEGEHLGTFPAHEL